MNTLQRRYKICSFALTVPPHCLVKVKTKVDCFLQCVLSNWLFVTFREIHSMFIFFSLLEKSVNSLLTENVN